MKTIAFVVLTVILTSCFNRTDPPMTPVNKKPDQKGSTSETVIISAPIVSQPFIWKGQALERTELYVQRSIQDYFIKFCESEVTRSQIEKKLSEQEGLIKALKLEVEFKNGEWDNCQDNKEEKVASRTGEYVVIHRIID